MWVCKHHFKKAITLLDVPHIRKAPAGAKCLLCHRNASLKLYYTHTTCKFKLRKQLGEQDEERLMTGTS
ncbi:hypothetical protein [Alkalihalobacillus sp. TS-13]|uniref:hypothetical protein n=1 Tax=Alkalihalobacillus sp. TS-13 TaxID=2842455 RepID=UPI001C879A6B|nr:hypothetical protein [Alkalihalobacillus sp. TS-13]